MKECAEKAEVALKEAMTRVEDPATTLGRAHVSGYAIWSAERKKKNLSNVLAKFSKEEIIQILQTYGRQECMKRLGCSRQNYLWLLKINGLSTKVAERRNTKINYTDEEIKRLYEKYGKNIITLCKNENIKRDWVIRNKLKSLGYDMSKGYVRREPIWNKGLTKEMHAGIAKGSKKVSEIRKKLFKEGKLNNIAQNRALQLKKRSKMEVRFKDILEHCFNLQEGVDFIYQQPVNNKFLCDFYFPTSNLIVELFGCYFHQCSRCHVTQTPKFKNQSKRDAAKVKYLQACGYSLKVIWEHDLKTKENMIMQIEEILRYSSSVPSGNRIP